MSRTLNTMPYEVQERRREPWRQRGRGYPRAYGGAWPGRKGWAQLRNRQLRRAQNAALRNGEELPIAKRTVAWDVW